MSRRGAFVASSIALAVAFGNPSAAAAASPYPATLPDFAHPGTPHAGLLTPASGDNDRSMLVVFGEFNDVAATPNVDAASIATQFFANSFGSVADFYRTSSFGKLTFTPAAESSGTANDGVVTVDLGAIATFNANPPDAGGYPSIGLHGDAIRGRKVVEAANAAVNFASFDRNSDGNVGDDELVVFLVQEANPTATDTNDCGATRSIKAGAALDGKTLNKAWSGGTTLTNTITNIHEISHQALGHNDHGYSAGTLDITGPTCPGGTPNTWAWDYNSWHKLHFGWIAPIIVTKDGYYDTGRWDTTGQAYILYDYDRGAQDYYLVENRVVTPGSYEKDAADSGLVIWRVDDRRFGMAPPNPYQLMRPDGTLSTGVYGGSSTDAWDPSDLATPQTTLDRPWSDGTDSKVAVRAIGPRGNTTRAYFDVRGPGILVNPSATVQTVLMAQTSPITFPVMNTGEATDSFAFTLVGLPAGWSATTQTQSIAADTVGTATVQLTVPGNVAVGNYTLTARGASATDSAVTTDAPITVKVEKRPTTLAYTGTLTADYSDPATVSAILTDTTSGAALAGKTVAFTIGTQSTTATTNSTGTASATIVINQPSATLTVDSAFTGDGTYVASSDSDSFAITKETLSFMYSGSTLVALGTTPTLAATGTEEADGSAGDLTLAQAQFSLAPTLTTTPFSYVAAMNAGGFGTTVASGLPVDVWTVSVAVPASNAYWEGSTAASTELILYDPAARFTGDAGGRDSVGNPIAVKLDAQYDRRGPKASIDVRFSGGSFTSRTPTWIVQVGDVAIIQATGSLNGSAATLRLRVDDLAEPGRPDTFRVQIGSYDSGTVTAVTGNLQSHL